MKTIQIIICGVQITPIVQLVILKKNSVERGQLEQIVVGRLLFLSKISLLQLRSNYKRNIFIFEIQ